MNARERMLVILLSVAAGLALVRLAVG